ncbi:hypothetical protein FNV43_RR17792 [Rhamnella rubrinervis]|uniref:DRBM domain-containing protein n=1 Tax=Rhamnella rubrinervis TaxID=2594499 RepID=A0A8K0E4G2_9ROSA|nr:hypothetical protein FNV43_RR17792 [Rhamnella rubrinervis]
MYKTRLQELCQQKKWALPTYSSTKDGPDHLPRFMASVSVNGLWFDSSTCFRSSKDAHNNAAMLAFLHFTSSADFSTQSVQPKVGEPKTEETHQGPEIQSDTKTIIDGFVGEDLNCLKNSKEDESGLYKKLLQELAKRECLCMPTYRTTKSGAYHRTPTFFSTVEVEGEMFYGTAGKSVKQAELSAAMVAYKSLIERRSTRINKLAARNLKNKAALKTTSSSKLKVSDEPVQNVKAEVVLMPCPALTNEGHSKEKKEAEKCSSHAKLSIGDCSLIPGIAKMDETITTRKQFRCSDSMSSPEEVLKSPRSTHPNRPASSDSNVGKANGTKSYLLCNKVRVYTEFPDYAFPKGITILPIAEDKWVAVSLEFPNEAIN